MRKLHEKDFKMENYEEFYTDHFFQPMIDSEAINAHRHLPRVAWALDVAKEVKPKKVLDLGCLEGFAVLTIANHLDIDLGIGIDLSTDGIELANSRKDSVKSKVEFHVGSIEDFLEKTEEKFDFIMMFEVIEHVKDPDYLLKLIKKVKTPDGQLLISTPSFESPSFGMDDEANKCHIRLYTTADNTYSAVNKYGNTRTGTSMKDQLKDFEIIEMGVYSHLINVRAV